MFMVYNLNTTFFVIYKRGELMGGKNNPLNKI